MDPLAIEDAVANLERTKAIRYGGYTVLTAYATYLDPVEATHRDAGEVRSRRNPTDETAAGVGDAVGPDVGVRPAPRGRSPSAAIPGST